MLDTNVISELIRPRPEPKVVSWIETVDEGLLYLSVLTVGEIRKGIASLTDASRRVKLEGWVDRDLHVRFAGRILPIDLMVADRWGRLAGKAAGQGLQIPVIDGLLSASALQFDLVLVTRDTRHLSTAGVPFFNPWKD